MIVRTYFLQLAGHFAKKICLLRDSPHAMELDGAFCICHTWLCSYSLGSCVPSQVCETQLIILNEFSLFSWRPFTSLHIGLHLLLFSFDSTSVYTLCFNYLNVSLIFKPFHLLTFCIDGSFNFNFSSLCS